MKMWNTAVPRFCRIWVCNIIIINKNNNNYEKTITIENNAPAMRPDSRQRNDVGNDSCRNFYH